MVGSAIGLIFKVIKYLCVSQNVFCVLQVTKVSSP